MIRVLTSLVLLVACGAPDSTAQERPNTWRYERLDLVVRIDSTRRTLKMEGAGRLRLESDTSTVLRLAMNGRNAAMRFTSVTTADGAAARLFSDSVRQRAELHFPRAIRRGETVDIRFAYQLTRNSTQLLLTDTFALASWVEAWYPLPTTFGQFQGWSAPGATTFHLPLSWRAVSNGRLESSVVQSGQRIERWVTDVAVNRSFSAAKYTVAQTNAHGRGIGVYLLTATLAHAKAQANVLARAISAMEKRFGPYPYASYAIAEVPENRLTWSASSEQGFIMATSSIFGAGGNLPLFAHEAAHGWWGNLVATAGLGARMMSEALAQYGAVIAIEELEGPAAAREFLRFSRSGYNELQSARGYFAMARMGPDVALSRLANGRWDHNLADSKGMWFYDMLRHRVGDTTFFNVLRGILRDYAGRDVRLDTLRTRFISAVPGDTALPAFMTQWLDRTGAPLLDLDWHVTERLDSARITIRQRGESYALNPEVELISQSGEKSRHRIAITDSVTTVTLPQRFVVDVKLDPDHRILRWLPEYGPPPRR